MSFLVYIIVNNVRDMHKVKKYDHHSENNVRIREIVLVALT